MGEDIEKAEDVNWAKLDAGGAPPEAALPEAEESQAALPAEEEEASAGDTLEAEGDLDIVHLLGVPLNVTVEVGRSIFTIDEILSTEQGSIIELSKKVGQHLDVMVNGKLAARGEIVVMNDKFALRITEVLDPNDRLALLSM